MNPLTGDPHYLNLLPKNSRNSASSNQVRENVSSVVFNDNSFSSDQKFFELDRQRRQAEFQKKQESYMKRREANVLKEAGRWQASEEDYKKSLQNLEVRRSKWQAGQKNNPSEAFNVLTLDYDNTQQGEYLKQKDEERRYREGLRLYNLDARMNSGFNIINGSTRSPPLPSRPYLRS